MSRRPEFLFIGALALAAVAIALPTGCDSKTSTAADTAQASADRAISVRTSKATTGSVSRTLRLGGTAAAWRSARLVPTGQGVVTSLPVTLGQEVRRGDLLAQLDTSSATLQLAQARKSADLARLQATEAAKEYDRAQKLAEAQAIASQTLDQAAVGQRVADAQVESADASLAVIRDAVQKARLTAPFDGTVTAVALEQGEFYTGMGGMGGPPMLVELQALDPIRLDVHVPDVDLRHIQPGMEVRVSTSALPERDWTGKVELVNAAADQGARTFLVRIRIPNEDRALRPGLFLQARLVLERHDGVVVVPERAVTRHDDGDYVMLVDGGSAKKQIVQLGLGGDEGREVAGLDSGTPVIVEGHFGLPDGAGVKVIGEIDQEARR